MKDSIKAIKTLCLCAVIIALSSCLPEDNRSSSGSSSLDTQTVKSQQYASDMLSSAAEIQVAVTQNAQWAAGTFPTGAINFAALGIAADVAANISGAHCLDAAGNNQILVWMTAQAGPAGAAGGRFALKGLGNNSGPMIAQKLSQMSGANVGLFDGQMIQLSSQNMGGQAQMPVPAGCNANIPVGAPVMVMEGSNAGAAVVTAGAAGSFEYQSIDCPAGQSGSITQRRAISIDPVTFAKTAVSGWTNFNSNCNNAVQGFNVAVTQGSAAAMNYAQLGGGGLSSILDTLAQIDCRNIQGNARTTNGTGLNPNDINFQGGTVNTGNGQTLSSSCNVGQGTVISVGTPTNVITPTGTISDQDTRDPMDCPPGDLNPFGSVVPVIIPGVTGVVDVGPGWQGIDGITFRRLYYGAQDQQGQILDERNFWQGDTINCTRDETLTYRCADVYPVYNNPPYTQTTNDGFVYTRQNQINGWANPATFIANPPLGINVGWNLQPPAGCGWDERYTFTNCEPGFTPNGQGQYSRPLVANQITDVPTPGPWVPENPSICQNTQVTYLPCPFGYTGNIERTTGFESRADYPATPDVAGGPTATPTVTQISQTDIDNCVCDTSIYEEQQMACSGGQVGVETQRRYWQCPGGSWGNWQVHSSTCSATAACGTADGQTLTAPPSTPGEYCSVGAGSGLVSNASGYLWTCTDTVTGSQANCSASRSVAPICGSPTAIICITDADCGGSPGSCNGGCCGPNPPLCPVGAAGLCPTGASDGDPCLGIANHVCQSNCCVPAGGPDCPSASSATLGDPGAGSPIFLPDGTIGDDIGYPCVVGAPGGPNGIARCTVSGWSSVVSCGTVADVNGQCGSLGNTPCISGTFSPGPGLTWRCLGSGNGSDANCGTAVSGCTIGGAMIPPGGWRMFGGANCMLAECSCSNVLTTSRPSLCPGADSIGTNTACTGNPAPICAPNQTAQCSVPLNNGTCTGTWSCQTVAQCGASDNQCTLGNLQDVADTSTHHRWDCVYAADTTVRDNCSVPRGSVSCVGDTVLYTGPACTPSGPGATIDQCSRAGACEGSNKVYRGCDNSIVQTITNDPSCVVSCPSVSAQSVDGNARSGQVLPGALPSTTTQYVCNGYNVSQAGCNASGNCGTATCQASGNWTSTDSCSGALNGQCGTSVGTCNVGTAFNFNSVGGGALTWQCQGVGGGSPSGICNGSVACGPNQYGQCNNANCSCITCPAGQQVNATANGCEPIVTATNGVCNSTGGCTSGTYQFNSISGNTQTYSCLGTNGGANQTGCTYDPGGCSGGGAGGGADGNGCSGVVNGSCGSASGGAYSNPPPSSQLCNAGTSTTPGGTSAQWLWTCQGLNGGSSANCSATRNGTIPIVNGVCNSNGGCSSGTYEFVSIGAPGVTTTFHCRGSGGGSDQLNCTHNPGPITSCPPGQYMTTCGGGADGCNCVSCLGNTIVNASQSGCVACPSGQTPNANHTACVGSTPPPSSPPPSSPPPSGGAAVNGVCGLTYNTCLGGTPQGGNGSTWNCMGQNGGTNATGCTPFSLGLDPGLGWSDERLKKNIEPMDRDATEIIGDLKPVVYEWNEVDSAATKGAEIGLTAQNIKNVIPEAVVEMEKDGEQRLAVKYHSLIPVLVKAVQELNEKVDALELENKELKDQLSKSSE